jgi:hypothetical protein
VSFCGRVVSVSVVFGKSKSQKAAKGWCGCVVRDDSGAICVSSFPCIIFSLNTIAS